MFIFWEDVGWNKYWSTEISARIKAQSTVILIFWAHIGPGFGVKIR